MKQLYKIAEKIRAEIKTIDDNPMDGKYHKPFQLSEITGLEKSLSIVLQEIELPEEA